MSYSQKPWLKHYHENIGEFAQIEEISLPTLLHRAAENFNTKTSLTFYTKQWSFLEVAGIAQKFSDVLASTGFEKGDRLAIMLPNSPHYIFSLFGTTKLGGIAVQVNPLYVEREIEHVLKDSGAETMVVLDLLYPRVKAVQERTSLKKIIVVSLTGQPPQLAEGDLLFEQFMSQEAPRVEDAVINPSEDVAVLQYTGGTTGVSKGVMLTHRNLISNLEQIYDFMFRTVENVPENPKVMAILPMFHIYGLTCNVFYAFRAGCNQIILPRFDVQEVLETVKREKPFQFSAVPTMYIGLNSHPNLEDYGFDEIEYYNSGGAAMPLEQLHLFEKRTGRQLNEGYGLSEASPTTHFNPPFHERRAGSIGIPLPSLEAKIVQPSADGYEEVPVGEVGELIVRGPQVMKGYWNNVEETDNVLRDGWLYTGDLARMDEDGYFYIVDRKKDMIIASGYNIYPREIEEVLYQHPAVQEAIVIGIPDAYRGETVKAFVALKEGEEVTEEELLAHAKQLLAVYKVPKFLEIRSELPKTAVGKLLKTKLREEEQAKLQKEA